MMGSGKSTVAKYLSQKLGCEYIEIDFFIEQAEKASISEIFANKGEAYFRKLESHMILSVVKSENQIIALGGGAFEDETTRQFLIENTTVVYLKTLPNTILERIKNDTSRPLLKNNMNIENISKIVNLRQKNYEKAKITITTDDKTVKEISNEIIGDLSL